MTDKNTPPMGQELPPLDKLPPFPEKVAGYLEQGANGVFLAYSWNPAAETRALFTEDQYRQGQREAIAPYAERIRHLERELEQAKAAFIGSENARKDAERARGTVQTIDTPEFRKLLDELVDAAELNVGTYHYARAALIAYIDGRTAGTAWISIEDQLPEPGERVLVTRFAGRVNNPTHPGYPGAPWLEVTRYMVNGSMFECDIISTGYVTHWTRIAAAPTPLNGKEGAK